MEYSQSDTLIIEKAFEYKAKGAFLEALDLLNPLEKKYLNDKVLAGLLATLFFELQDYENSEKYFRKASQLNPKSELSSLGLFHSLFHQNKTLLGLEEIQRFTSSNKYKLYKTTISELKSNFDKFDNLEKEIIRNLR